MTLLLQRDFNIVINGTESLHGQLLTTSVGGIIPQRKELKLAGSALDRNPIAGFKYDPPKFKVGSYPNGLNSLPINSPIAFNIYEYLLDEDTSEEIGIRHHWIAELDRPKQGEAKPDDFPDYEFILQNPTVYRRYVENELIDDAPVNGPLMLNKKQIWGKRNAKLGIPG